MANSRRYDVVIDAEFLPLRAKILELAAGLDRLDRATGAPCDGDPRPRQLVEAIELLGGDKPNRAEQVQLLFSRQYDGNWRRQFEV